MTRIIKKYPNRRLYDTEQSRYITLDEIKDLILKNIDFQVIDAKTQEDISNYVLLQIISEQESKATPIFSRNILENLIRFYGHSTQPMMSNFLEFAMHFFSEQQHELQKQAQLFINNNPLQVMRDFSQQSFELWHQLLDSMQSAQKSEDQVKENLTRRNLDKKNIKT